MLQDDAVKVLKTYAIAIATHEKLLQVMKERVEAITEVQNTLGEELESLRTMIENLVRAISPMIPRRGRGEESN